MVKRGAAVSSLAAFAGLALVLAVLGSVATRAQTRIVRIGVLSALPAPSPGQSPATHEPLLRGLRELGWIESQHIVLEYRFANWQLNAFLSLLQSWCAPTWLSSSRGAIG
jgi:hypothetical protein